MDDEKVTYILEKNIQCQRNVLLDIIWAVFFIKYICFEYVNWVNRIVRGGNNSNSLINEFAS